MAEHCRGELVMLWGARRESTRSLAPSEGHKRALPPPSSASTNNGAARFNGYASLNWCVAVDLLLNSAFGPEVASI